MNLIIIDRIPVLEFYSEGLENVEVLRHLLFYIEDNGPCPIMKIYHSVPRTFLKLYDSFTRSLLLNQN